MRPLEESTFEVVIGARRLNSRMYPPEMGIDDKLDKVLEKLSQASLVCDDCHLVGDVDVFDALKDVLVAYLRKKKVAERHSNYSAMVSKRGCFVAGRC